MDWAFILNIFKWLPWYSISYDNFILQLSFIYLILSFTYVYNCFIILLNLFFFLVLLSVTLGILQLDLFLGFFLVIELSVIFVSVILLFFLNPKGLDYAPNLLKINYSYLSLFPLLLVFLVTPYLNLNECYFFNFNYAYIWFNCYESIRFLVKNDFLSLFFSYYIYNSVTFIIVGLILFVGSLICITLNVKVLGSKKAKSLKYMTSFKELNLFSSFSFMRRQDLNVQAHANMSIKIVSKKNGAKKLNNTTSE